MFVHFAKKCAVDTAISECTSVSMCACICLCVTVYLSVCLFVCLYRRWCLCSF